MKFKLSYLTVLIILLLSIFSLAVHQDGPDIDYSNPQEVNDLDSADLAAAIENGQIKDMSVVRSDQLAKAVGSNPTIAFELESGDLVRAVSNDLSLLEGQIRMTGPNPVFVQMNNEAEKNVDILNDNPEIKEVWFKNWGIIDEGAELTKFNQQTNKISIFGYPDKLGPMTTSFNYLEVPAGSKVLRDGTLVTPIGSFAGINDLSREKGPRGTSLITEGQPTYHVEGGFARISTDVKSGSLVASCSNAGDINSCTTVTIGLPNRALPATFGWSRVVEGETAYIGNFRFLRNNEGDIINADDGNSFIRKSAITVSGGLTRANFNVDLIAHRIDGAIIEPGDRTKGVFSSRLDEFILTKGSMENIVDKTMITYSKGERLYYSENSAPDSFCKDGFSCVTNTQGYKNDPHYRGKLEFKSVENGDKIIVSSPAYFDKIKANHLKDGEAIFGTTKINENGEIIPVAGVIFSSNSDELKIMKNLNDINVGRIDQFYEKNGEEKISHWSSNQNFKDPIVGKYFGRKEGDSFVTCAAGVNCEERFAQSFGKVIPSRSGGRPKTTIIVAGDTISTSQNLENWCKQDGCLIIGSRDMPPTTGSENVVIGAHHYSNSQNFWRDAPDATKDGHNPIDVIRYQDLPGAESGVSVKNIKLSACNTIRRPAGPLGKTVSDDTAALFEKFPDSFIEGWDGTAPFHEPINKIIGQQDDLSKNKLKTGMGIRSWVWQDPFTNEYFWSDGTEEIKIEDPLSASASRYAFVGLAGSIH